jgi:hypothetical protein
MQAFRVWSFGRVAAIGFAWTVLVIVYYFRHFRAFLRANGDPDLFSVSFGVLEAAVILFGPPALLLVAWALFRRWR